MAAPIEAVEQPLCQCGHAPSAHDPEQGCTATTATDIGDRWPGTPADCWCDEYVPQTG